MIIVAGVMMGWSLEGVLWRLRPTIDRVVVKLAGHAGRLWRKRPPQWFRRQTPSDARPAPVPAQHTIPRPIRGQRPSEGAHRARQRKARFGSRSFRRRA